MARSLTDVIIWVGIGLSLVAQAGFVLSAAFLEGPSTDGHSMTHGGVDAVLVGVGFLVAGGAALWRGLRSDRGRLEKIAPAD